MDIIEEQLLITQHIIDHAFLKWGPGRRFLLTKKNGDTTTKYPLNCTGCFDWRDGFNSDHAMLTIFPVFFDYLDLYVEKKLNLAGEGFASKSAALTSMIDDHKIESIFLAELYELSAALRNKVLHHDFERSDKTLRFKQRTIRTSDVKFLNEIIFQYVRYGMHAKSWYEINAMYSHLHSVINDVGNRFTVAVRKNENFVVLHGDAQHHGRLHDSRRLCEKESHHRVFDYCCSYVRSGNPDSALLEKYPDPDQEIVFSGLYYLYENDSGLFLFPSDLIREKPETRFSDLLAWSYHAA